MKALRNSASEHMFLFIAVSISLYFGAHGYLFLSDPEGWDWPWYLSLFTIFLIEIVWLNVFRAKTYDKWFNLVASLVAIVLCVFLPLYSSWSDFRGLEKQVAVTIELADPEYNEDKVIPALDDELKALEDRIAPRIAERERRLRIGNGIYKQETLKDGTVKITTGYKAASWVPYGRKERADFRRVEQLKNQIRLYREQDKTDRNAFKGRQETRKVIIAGIEADLTDGRDSLIFKGAMIIILAAFSLYYMYSYNNPSEKDQQSLVFEPMDIDQQIARATRKPAKNKIVKSEDMKFVLEKYPEAISKISDDRTKVFISAGRVHLGVSNNAPNAWRNAKNRIAREDNQ